MRVFGAGEGDRRRSGREKREGKRGGKEGWEGIMARMYVCTALALVKAASTRRTD